MSRLFRPFREVYGGDPEWRSGLVVHSVPIERCEDCALLSKNPGWAERQKYIVHPRPGESIDQAVARSPRPKRGGSEYFLYRDKEALRAEARHHVLEYEIGDGHGTTKESTSGSCLLLYAPQGFPEGIGRFPDEFGVVAGLRETSIPLDMRRTAFDWYRYEVLGVSTAEVGGTLFAAGVIRKRGFVADVISPYVSAMAEITLRLVQRLEPALVLCGEATEAPHRVAYRVAHGMELWSLNWVNVFGPAYVQKYGWDFLMGAPGFLKQELPGGYVLYQVTKEFIPGSAGDPTPDQVEGYFADHPAIKRVTYRPWLRTVAR